MFLTDKLCYLDLHRTGSVQLIKMLKIKMPDGKILGNHGRASNEIANSDRLFIGSIRNPWDWYVSVWSKGCDGKGFPYSRHTRKIFFSNLGFKISPIYATVLFFNQIFKPIRKWKELYSDNKSKKNFKLWLSMILKERIYDEGAEYGLSSIKDKCGLYTFRYLSLFSKSTNFLFQKNKSLDHEDIKQIDKKNNLVKFFITTENLLSDFKEALNKLNISLEKSESDFFSKMEKTNLSYNREIKEYYYDRETIKLIEEYDQFIIEKHKYVYNN